MSVRTTTTGGTARTENTVSTYLTDDKLNSARTKDSYKVRFFDGKAPGTADDGKINKEPHPHNQNWGRTGLLLMEGGTIILRLLFDEKVNQISDGNLSAYLKLPANYQILFDLYQGKVISPFQWDILYPKNKAHLVTSLEFDIIILYILVLNTCQYKGEILMDIQKIGKRRDSMYDFAKEARIIDAKFDTEYEAVGAVLTSLTVSRELGRDVQNRIKNMVKNLKTVIMTKDEILIYLDMLKRWYLSDIDIRKGMKELKPMLKAGQGDTKRAKDILSKLKMVAEDDSNTLNEMKDMKSELEKLASDLEGIKKKKTKLKTVLNILSILTPRFSKPFNMESVALSIPCSHQWTDGGIQFVLNFYCQGQLHVYTRSTKLVIEAKLKVFLGDERIPNGEVEAIKSLNTAKIREQLITDLRLGGVGTLTFKERSFWVVPIDSNEQAYRKLFETVQIPLWKTSISNIFKNEQVKTHLNKGGCLCFSSGGDPTVMVDIRCRGSDINLNSVESTTVRPTPYEWHIGQRKFVVKKYFLGKRESSAPSKGSSSQYVVVDLTVKRGNKVDTQIESKFAAQLNDKIDLKTMLAKQGVSSVKCDVGKSTITIGFNSSAVVKEFHDKFRYEDIKSFVSKIFEEPKVQKIFGNASFNIYIDVMFSEPEVECKGLPEPASPTAPRHLKVVDVTTTSVVVKWDEPLSNGGINITGYTIERYDLADKKWLKVGVAEPSDTSYHVTNLTTSHEYFFRITAENLAGSSPIVETSDPVMLSRTKALKGTEVAANVIDDKVKSTPRDLPNHNASATLLTPGRVTSGTSGTKESITTQHDSSADQKRSKEALELKTKKASDNIDTAVNKYSTKEDVDLEQDGKKEDIEQSSTINSASANPSSIKKKQGTKPKLKSKKKSQKSKKKSSKRSSKKQR